MSLERRLTRLEARLGDVPCPACQGRAPVVVRVAGQGDGEPGRCPVCGWPLVVTIMVIDTRCRACGEVYASGGTKPCPRCGTLPNGG